MSSLSRSLVAGLLLSISLQVPAYAGFQWAAPDAGQGGKIAPRAPTVAPRVAAAPIAPVMAENLPKTGADMGMDAPFPTTPDGPISQAPIHTTNTYAPGDDPTQWNQPHSAGANTMAPRPPVIAQPAAPQPLLQPAAQQPMPMQPQAQPQQAPMVMGAGTYAMAEGFGRDLPLVMALRQIVPPSYGFVFDPRVDLSRRISWQGGMPWDMVLQNTLAPLGLSARIQGTSVSILSNAATTNSATAMDVPAPIGADALAMQNMQAGPALSSSTTPLLNTPPATLQVTSNLPAQQQTQAPLPVIDMTNVPHAPANLIPASTGGMMAQTTPADVLAQSSTWTAERASTLRKVLEDWTTRAGVELYWASEYDYPIKSAVAIDGTFETAVQTLLRGLSESRPRPLGRLHPNLPNGPAVLVIETRQNDL